MKTNQKHFAHHAIAKTNQKHFREKNFNVFCHSAIAKFYQKHFCKKTSTIFRNSAIARTNQKHFRALSGFTIAELSLAMGFISTLLITVAILIVHLIGTFQKGLSIKSVDTMGQSLSDNLSRTISASQGSNFSSARDNYYQQWISSDSITIKNTSGRQISTTGKVPTRGFFKTGNFTYVWNTGYVLNENESVYNLTEEQATVKDQDNKEYKNFRLLRVKGTPKSISADGKTYEFENTPVELLASSESALAIYDFQIFSAAYDTNTQHAYVSGTFILGTISGGIDITSNSNFCTDVPDGLTTDFNYCAINKFSFGTRTGIGQKDTSDLSQ